MFKIKPSNIEGVGVFTTSPLKKGELVDIFEEMDCVFVPKPQPEEEMIMLNNYAIEEEGGWWRPENWKKISVGWYLNHSDNPNIFSNDEANTYLAIRDIEAEEELTINYDLLN